MPPEQPAPHRFSVEEFNELGETGFFGPEDRVELLNGEIIVMSPKRSPPRPSHELDH